VITEVPPGAVPVIAPVVLPIGAIELLLLLQIPVVASVSPIVDPTHTDVGPTIAAGTGFTVTTVVVKQPVPNV
jgi:hypothetical protein